MKGLEKFWEMFRGCLKIFMVNKTFLSVTLNYKRRDNVNCELLKKCTAVTTLSKGNDVINLETAFIARIAKG